jgi:hypothetical protein
MWHASQGTFLCEDIRHVELWIAISLQDEQKTDLLVTAIPPTDAIPKMPMKTSSSHQLIVHFSSGIVNLEVSQRRSRPGQLLM